MEQVNNISEFLNKIERYKNYSGVFFRGQSEEHRNITSSISRNPGYIKNEYAFYNEAIELKSVEFEGLSTPIERLSKMQHYGIPTRLIDFSVDPLIALFFAVQDVKSESESSGNVYVFVQKKYSLEDKKIKLLALLAILDSLEIETIINTYSDQYSEEISKAEILEFASEGAFIEHTDDLKKSNRRLYSQRGTFAICGNNVEEDRIQRLIKPLDSIIPSMIIRVPFEHKNAVKRELDEKYNINETTIYPEFPSVADYLKEKYKSTDFEPSASYSIVEEKEISTPGAKRISVIAVLNKVIRIEDIKIVGIEIINKRKEKYDVVWVYIAKNGDDYIMRNWIVRGQWIRDELDSRYKPLEIGPSDEQNYRWRFENLYSTLSDYYAEYAFDEDKALYAYNIKTLDEIKPYYLEMIQAFKDNDILQLMYFAKNYGKLISRVFIQFENYGHSRNDAFNKYLDNFQEFGLHLDNAVLWLNKESINERAKMNQTEKCFREAQKHLKLIEEEADYWKKSINITDAEFEKIDPKEYEKKEYQYIQTLPINPNGLEVWFNLAITKRKDNTIAAKGTTNLFDRASIMLSIKDSKGYLLGQSKSEVKDGKFDFGLFSRNGGGYLKGTYEANISLSIPSVQDKDFIKKAGIEYENLIGSYVERKGIGPTLNYYQKFNI